MIMSKIGFSILEKMIVRSSYKISFNFLKFYLHRKASFIFHVYIFTSIVSLKTIISLWELSVANTIDFSFFNSLEITNKYH